MRTIDRARGALFLALAISISIGCQAPDQPATPSPQAAAPKSASAPPKSPSGPTSFVGDWTGENGLFVTFNKDHTFFQNGQLPMTGKWIVTGDQAKVDVDKIGGRSIEAVADALARQSGRLAMPEDIAKTKRKLANIVYTLSTDGTSIRQHLEGMKDVTFARATP